jgi:hypothetical protein
MGVVHTRAGGESSRICPEQGGSSVKADYFAGYTLSFNFEASNPSTYLYSKGGRVRHTEGSFDRTLVHQLVHKVETEESTTPAWATGLDRSKNHYHHRHHHHHHHHLQIYSKRRANWSTPP